MATKNKKSGRPQPQDKMYQILLVDAEQNNRDYAKRLEEMQRTESDLRRNIASLESCCMTQRTSMAQLVQDKVGLCQELKRAESKINDLCQEIATLTSRQQILKGCLRDSSSIIRDILDSN